MAFVKSRRMRTYFFLLYCCQQAVIARDATQSEFSIEGSFPFSSSASFTSSLDSFERVSSLQVTDSSSSRVRQWMDVIPLQRLNQQPDYNHNHDASALTLPNVYTFDAEPFAENTRKPSDMSKDGLEFPTVRPSSGVIPADLTSTTRRNIYIRGQRINAPDLSRQVGLRKAASRDLRNPPNFQDSDVDASKIGANETFANTTTKKRTVMTNRRRFYNFKLLHDSLQGENDSRHGESQFYALLYGIGILLATSLVTLIVCLMLGICRQKIKTRMDKRRRFDKSGEYERVDSVSSIVDSACSSQMEAYIDDAIEDVTII